MASLGIIPCKPRSSFKQETTFELPTRTTKVYTLTLPKTRPPSGIADAHLSYLCKTGRFSETVTALDEFARDGLKINSNTFSNLLDYCINFNVVELGRELHARVNLVDRVETFVGTKLVSMYAKCGQLTDARKVFDELVDKDLYTWSAMMGAYSREQKWEEVVELFGMMMEDGTLPDEFMYPKIFQACGNCGYYETGKMVHSLVVRSGMYMVPRVCNALLSWYVKCGRFGSARMFFGKMALRDMVSWNSIMSGYCKRGENHEAVRLLNVMSKEGILPGLVTWNILIYSYMQSHNCDGAMDLMRKMKSCGVEPDVFTWTSMISGLVQNNKLLQALELLNEMISVGVEPTAVTITSALSACASLKSLNNGQELHCASIKRVLSDSVLVGNSLVEMYSKCGDLEAARQVFDLMSEKDIYTWNSMIGGYCRGAYCGKAHDLFMKMQESEVKPNVVTWNVMMLGYMHNGDEEEAVELFQKMIRGGKVQPDTSSWNAVISGYLHNREKNKALGLFRKMQCLSIIPNSVTILTVLPACANLVAANKVREIHACVLRRSLESNISVSNCLIDSYAKSGNIDYSRFIFDSMPSKDIITWNSMITGFVFHGCADNALGVFDEMKRAGLKPNRSTFVSLILAYSYKKMVQKGTEAFHEMTDKYQIIPGPEHHAAMVDLFGRSGMLMEATEFIESMTTEPDSAVWDALLSAVRLHSDVKFAVHAAESFLKRNPGNNIVHQFVSQANNTHGRKSVDSFDESKSSKWSYTQKVPGSTLVEMKNKVYSFITGDRYAPRSDLEHAWWNRIKTKSPDSCDMSSFKEEEEEEETCGVHSEKLALGFALFGSPITSQPIRIMKNFRSCGDCHNAAKLASLSFGREIFLTDTKCLHHFKDGCCSCGDYW